MAKYKYGMQKPVQNDLQQCINSFERMKRGGIGIADECVEDTCKRALKYIDKLEAKLAESEPVSHGHWIPMGDCGVTRCSCCGWSIEECIEDKYCRGCGAKMDETS